jgi:hypothetical protein
MLFLSENIKVLSLHMHKAVVFNIDEKKDDQQQLEMAMTPDERLLLCLDLIDLSIALSKDGPLRSNDDQIQWIELRFKRDAEPGS